MIGCHLIKNYGFDSRSVCGWVKMCRRGSVMGPQHFFLDKYMKNIENIRKSKELETTIIKHDHKRRESIAVIKVPSSAVTMSETRIARPPRKNNIIHIVPMRSKHGVQNNPMRKYKFETHKIETKRNKPKITSQPISAAKSVANGNIDTNNKTEKTVHRSVGSRPISVGVRANSKNSSEVSPPPKRTRKHGVSKSPSIRPGCVNLTEMNLDAINKSRAKIQPKPRKRPRPMNKRSTKTQETIRSANTCLVNSWSNWGGKIIDGFVSQSKSKIYGLINSVYSRNGMHDNVF